MRTYMLAAVVALAVTHPAAAQHWYAGGAAGVSVLADWDEETIDDGSLSSTKADDEDIASRLFLGREFTEHFRAELGYTDLGKWTMTSQSNGCCGFWAPGRVRATAEASGVEASAVGVAPVSRKWSLSARAGLLFWDEKLTVSDTSGSFSGTDDGTDILFGVGVEFSPVRRFGLRADLARYQLDDDDVDTATASVTIRLGPIPK